MKFELNLKEKQLALTAGASKNAVLCWIIGNQQSQIQWWRAWAVGMTVAFIVYIVTGKLVLGSLVP